MIPGGCISGPAPSPARRRRPAAALAAVVGVAAVSALAACSDEGAAPARPEPVAIAGVQARMAFGAGFYDAPFPGDHRLRSDGRPDVSGFPNPEGNALLGRVLTILDRDVQGFGLTSGVFFAMTGALAPGSLPDLIGSTTEQAQVFLQNVDPASPEVGRRHPVEARFLDEGGPFGAPNLLALLPLQGLPLRPGTRYAAVVRRQLGDAAGQPLGVPRSMAALQLGQRPEGMSAPAFEAYRGALDVLRQRGTAAVDIAALTVFTTGDPAAGMRTFYAHARSQPALTLATPLAPREVFDDFCVYEASVVMPVYQRGEPPFDSEGGGWAVDAQGQPAVQRTEPARVVLTVPRRPMPAAGYPAVVFSRTGGGGDRPLVDRGRRSKPGGEAAVAGTGPAQPFARAGWGGLSIDGPHGGQRNVSGGDEQFLMFNVTNPEALRDNVRQSALELGLAAHLLDTLEVDVSACPGAGQEGKARYDGASVALMGHSMGATIAPLALAVEPRFRAALLSGAGGSWIENIIFKQKPLAVRGFMEILLGVAGELKLHPHDPALSLFQWAGEPADPPVYGTSIVDEATAPRHILMMQGMVDRYILPSIANATSLSLGLDLGGDALDEQTPEVASFRPLRTLLPLSQRQVTALPASANRARPAGDAVTALVTQHREDGLEDGHEVVFQTPGPRHQYRCFLQTLAERGTPTVPAPGAEDDACP